jgi:hypothetical protein
MLAGGTLSRDNFANIPEQRKRYTTTNHVALGRKCVSKGVVAAD